MQRLSLMLLAFVLASPTYAAMRAFTSQANYYLGVQIGHNKARRSDPNSDGGSTGYGLTATVRGMRHVDFGVIAQTNRHPQDESTTLYIFNPTMEIHPFRSLSELTVTLGVGPGIYHLRSALGPQTKLGGSFGGGVDILMTKTLRLGLSSRYHAIFNQSELDDFWSLNIRVGMGWK